VPGSRIMLLKTKTLKSNIDIVVNSMNDTSRDMVKVDWTCTGTYITYLVAAARKIGVDPLYQDSGKKGFHAWVKGVPWKVEAFIMSSVSH
jgi:hypothetical protein